MRYLKRYNESQEVVDKINKSHSQAQDIKDICLELEDNDFFVNVSGHYVDECNIFASKHKFYKLLVGEGEYTLHMPTSNLPVWFDDSYMFSYSDIEEVIERVKSYSGRNVTCIFDFSVIFDVDKSSGRRGRYQFILDNDQIGGDLVGDCFLSHTSHSEMLNKRVLSSKYISRITEPLSKTDNILLSVMIKIK